MATAPPKVKRVKVRGQPQYGVQCSACGDLLETLDKRAAGALVMVHQASHAGELGEPI